MDNYLWVRVKLNEVSNGERSFYFLSLAVTPQTILWGFTCFILPNMRAAQIGEAFGN